MRETMLLKRPAPADDLWLGLWVGTELLLVVVRTWLAAALATAIASVTIDRGLALGLVAGIAVLLAALPYRSVRALAATKLDSGHDPSAYRRGLVMALLIAIAALWIATFGFLTMSLGFMSAAPRVPSEMTAGFPVLAAAVSLLALAALLSARKPNGRRWPGRRGRPGTATSRPG
jgi:hypothetical protein